MKKLSKTESGLKKSVAYKKKACTYLSKNRYSAQCNSLLIYKSQINTLKCYYIISVTNLETSKNLAVNIGGNGITSSKLISKIEFHGAIASS